MCNRSWGGGVHSDVLILEEVQDTFILLEGVEMGASSTGVCDDINGNLICRAELVLHLLKNLGHFDLLLVLGIFFFRAREPVPSSVSVRKSVRTSHWNNQASLRSRFVRDLHCYFSYLAHISSCFKCPGFFRLHVRSFSILYNFPTLSEHWLYR